MMYVVEMVCDVCVVHVPALSHYRASVIFYLGYSTLSNLDVSQGPTATTRFLAGSHKIWETHRGEVLEVVPVCPSLEVCTNDHEHYTTNISLDSPHPPVTSDYICINHDRL